MLEADGYIPTCRAAYLLEFGKMRPLLGAAAISLIAGVAFARPPPDADPALATLVPQSDAAGDGNFLLFGGGLQADGLPYQW